jgi:hypothetical protein
MPNSKPTNGIKISLVRDTARRKLQHLTRGEKSIQERYLIHDEFLCGIHYESGPISFHWNADDDFASVKRGDLLIETVGLTGGQESRRAA